MTTQTTNDLAILVSPALDQDDSDIAGLIQRIAKWQQLFSSGHERYSLDGYEDLFEESAEGLLIYDNYAATDTRWRGFARYRRIWEREINENFPGITVYRIELDRAEAFGDLAWTAFTWFGRIELSTGIAWPTQHATHVWKRVRGQWRIIHEHLTSGVKEGGAMIEHERPLDPTRAGALWRHSRGRPFARPVE